MINLDTLFLYNVDFNNVVLLCEWVRDLNDFGILFSSISLIGIVTVTVTFMLPGGKQLLNKGAQGLVFGVGVQAGKKVYDTVTQSGGGNSGNNSNGSSNNSGSNNENSNGTNSGSSNNSGTNNGSQK